MSEANAERDQLKPIIQEILTDLFDITDVEEAKLTPLGRLINVEAKVGSLAYETRNLGSGLRAELQSITAQTKGLEADVRESLVSLNSELNSISVQTKEQQGKSREQLEDLSRQTRSLESIVHAEVGALNGKIEPLEEQVKTLENNIRAELKAIAGTNDAKLEALEAKVKGTARVQYFVIFLLLAVVAGLAKIIFFPNL